MEPKLPPKLIGRLDTADASALDRLIRESGPLLRGVYERNVADHVEARGDDAQLFGLKNYKHARHGFAERFADDDLIHFDTRPDGSYEILVGPFRIRVDSLGDFAHEDVLTRFPDHSPAKRSFAAANQLRLFSVDEDRVAPSEGAELLNCLTIGHLGNPREGLVKWYVGAWTHDRQGRPYWAWIERQDLDDGNVPVEPLTPREPLTPYYERPRAALNVEPRQRA